MDRSARAFALIFVVGLFAFGCSSDDASVSGIATLDDAPLKAGTVTFHPVSGGPAAIGEIDSDGRYKVNVGDGKRLPPGEYVVTVLSNEPPKIPADPATAPMPGKRITPEKYSDVAKSDLKVTVKTGSNSIDLKLSLK